MVNKSLKNQIEALSRDKQTNMSRRNYKEVAEICNYLGELLMQDARYEDAISEHETELEMCEKTHDALGKAIANRKIGECYCAMGSFDKALDFQQQHLAIARQLSNEIEQQRAHATLGRTYLCKAEVADDVRGALVKAEQSFQSSLSIALVLKDDIEPGEYSAMVGRLYLNLGLVAEISGKITRAIKYLQDARTEISGKKLDDEEQKCLSTLSALYQKTGNLSSAREFADKTFVLTKRLKQKSGLAECLYLRAGIFLESESFAEARHCLKRLLKSKSTETDMRQKATRMLHSLAKIRETTTRLRNCQEKAKRLNLLEAIGDLFCGNECYYTGLRYYKKMLDVAVDLGRPERQLASIYVSLAQTCADLKMYKEAVKFCLEEIKLRTDPVQLCRTWLNIADYTYRSENNDDLIIDLYNNAVKEAERADNPKLLLQCLQELQTMYRHAGDPEKSSDLDERVRRLRLRVSSMEEDEDEDLDSPRSPTPDLEDLSSVTESEDDQGDQEDDLPLRRRGQYKVRRNEKGETPLHVAVISGSLKRVRHLLSQGHPVNERDHCGWLPIHEAANHNCLDIAKLLIENNASLDDQGLAGCNGLTPVLDAAYNGHLEMVRLLFERGASLVKKDNDGNTVIDALYAWKNDNPDDTSGVNFENLVADLQASMLQSGAQPHELRNTAAKSSSSRRITSTAHPGKSNESVNTARSRRSVSPHLDSNPTELYREAIVGMGGSRQRKRKRSVSPKFQKSSNDDALIRAEEFVGDNWLEEDIIMMDRPTPLSKNTAALLFTSGSRPQSSGTKSGNKFDARSESPRPKPGSQASTISQGSLPDRFHKTTSTKTESNKKFFDISDIEILDVPDQEDNDDEELVPVPTYVPSRAVSISRNFPERTTTAPPPANSREQAIRRLRVRIQDMVVLVPLPSGMRKSISWLAEEASSRYAETKGLKPRLQLFTSDGAVLSSTDLVSDVVGELEEVSGTAISWDLPSISERYSKACHAADIVVYQNILHAMTVAVDTQQLVLDDLMYASSVAMTVLRAIQFQSSMRHLSFGSCPLGDSLVPLLSDVVGTMPHLASLNLSGTDLTETSLEIFRRSLNPTAPGSAKPLQSVTKMDLSHNNFPTGIRAVMDILAALPNVEEVALADCGFTSTFLDDISEEFRETLEKCGKLRSLSFAMNPLGGQGFAKLLACCPRNIRTLNLSVTIQTSCGPPPSLSREIDHIYPNLREISLSYCKLNGEWLRVLDSFLKKSVDLNKINFEGNRELDVDDVCRILQLILRQEVSWSVINLSGLSHCDECWDIIRSVVENCLWIMQLNITFKDPINCQRLRNLWEAVRGSSVIWCKMTGTVYCTA